MRLDAQLKQTGPLSRQAVRFGAPAQCAEAAETGRTNATPPAWLEAGLNLAELEEAEGPGFQISPVHDRLFCVGASLI